MADAGKVVIQKAGYQSADIDWSKLPHQANQRIIKAVAEMLLSFPMERVMVNIEKYINTTAATIPLCLLGIWNLNWKKATSRTAYCFWGGYTWELFCLHGGKDGKK